MNGSALKAHIRRCPLLAPGFLLILLAAMALPACIQQYPDFDVVISNYDPAQAYPGNTFFQSHLMSAALFEVTMEGELLWEYRHDNFGLGFNFLGDGELLAQTGGHPEIIDVATSTQVWSDPNLATHHTIMETPWGTVLSLGNEWLHTDYGPAGSCQYLADYVVEFNRNAEVVWEWHLAEHVDPAVYHPDGFCGQTVDGSDWSHCNTVKLIQNYHYRGTIYPAVVVLLSRELDTFWMIDYATGDILWSCGQNGTFGRREPPAEPLFNKAHEIDRLANGNFLLFDNGTDRVPQVSRALEFRADPAAGTATEVWSWTDPESVMFAPWGGDADRLPNGNTLIGDVLDAKIVELNPAGEKVWQMQLIPKNSIFGYSIYQMKRASE
jgi:hypothetical protein